MVPIGSSVADHAPIIRADMPYQITAIIGCICNWKPPPDVDAEVAYACHAATIPLRDSFPGGPCVACAVCGVTTDVVNVVGMKALALVERGWRYRDHDSRWFCPTHVDVRYCDDGVDLAERRFVSILEALTDRQREDLFERLASQYCSGCWRKLKQREYCSCRNDE